MTAQSESMRLFVALELSEAWKQAIGRLQDEMRQALSRQLGESVRPRWVRPEGVHLTLKFLGETPAERLEAIESALSMAVTAEPGFSLSLGNVGSFADRRASRIIMAGVLGDTKALAKLAERVETWLAAAGFPREKRGFQPHLTLARLPDRLDDVTRRRVADITCAFSTPEVDSWAVRSVSLIRSRLGPEGARYERLRAFPS